MTAKCSLCHNTISSYPRIGSSYYGELAIASHYLLSIQYNIMQNTNKLIGRLTLITCLAWLCLLLISDNYEPTPQHLRRELMLGKLSPQQVRILQEEENNKSSSASSEASVRSSLGIDEYDIPEWLSSASDMKVALRQHQQSTSTERSFIPPQFLSTVQYNLQDAIESTSSFMNTVGILLYTPKSNQFKMYYNTKDMKWAASCRKLSLAFKEFVMLLRYEFPARFQQDEDELAIVISGGDYPKLSRNCLLSFPNTSDECISHKTPILQFGSVFRPPTYSQSLPNMLMMPMSATHLTCFTQYGVSNKEKVCDSFSEKTPNAKRYMVFGDTSTKFEVRVCLVCGLLCLCVLCIFYA